MEFGDRAQLPIDEIADEAGIAGQRARRVPRQRIVGDHAAETHEAAERIEPHQVVEENLPLGRDQLANLAVRNVLVARSVCAVS